MVALFASLKYRLVTSRLRALPPKQRAGVLAGLLVALLAVGFAAWGISRLSEVPQAGYLVVTGLFALQLVAWTLTPLVAFGVDETVDPSKFALLPLRVPALQRGLLVSSLVGYLPLFNAVVLVGAALGVSFRASMLPLALVCAALQLVTVVVFSRAAATSMATLMTSRRGRDLGMVVGFGVLVVYMGASTALNSGGAGLASASRTIAEVLAWSPPGALASLPAFVETGQWGRAGIAAATALVFVAIGWAWWSRALGRSLVSVDSDTSSSAPSHGLGGRDAVGTTTRGVSAVVAGRDRTLIWRDPMRRLTFLIGAFMGIAWALLVFPGTAAVYATAFGAVLLGSQAANQLGLDGSGLWLHLVAFGDTVRARGELLGHALAALLPSIPVIGVCVVVVAVVRDGWGSVPGALAVDLAVLGGTVAVSTLLSPVVPYAVPQSRKSMFASSVPAQKSRAFRSSFGSMLGGILSAAPVIGLAVLGALVDPLWSWVALVVGIALPVVWIRLAVTRGARAYLERGPEILAVVMAGDRS